MGTVRSLVAVVDALESLDPEATIYVAAPWTGESAALVEFEPAAGGLPEAAVRDGLKYFLEVFVARDLLADWQMSLNQQPTAEERCERLIHYAVNDA